MGYFFTLGEIQLKINHKSKNHRILSMKATHPTAQLNIIFPLHPVPHFLFPHHIQSTLRASFPAPPTPSPHNAPLSCSPCHNPSTQQCPLSTPTPSPLPPTFITISHPLYKQSPFSYLAVGGGDMDDVVLLL